MSNIDDIVKNAVANASVEDKVLSKGTIRMIERCLKTDNGSFLFQLYLKSKRDSNIDSDSDYINENTNSKYCYSNGVLKNYFNVKDWELLHIIDGDNVAYYETQIVSGNSDYEFKFDVDSYLKLHKILFGNVYSFAGDIRDEFIYKSCMPYIDRKTPFCMPGNIYRELKKKLQELEVKLSRVNNKDSLLDVLSYYYGEFNMIHPFREGNGRTLRLYFRLMLKNLSFSFGEFDFNYFLWDSDDIKELTKSTIINSINCDTDGIKKCFDKVIIERAKNKSR